MKCNFPSALKSEEVFILSYPTFVLSPSDFPCLRGSHNSLWLQFSLINQFQQYFLVQTQKKSDKLDWC